MIELELSSPAREVVEDLGEVTPDEDVLVIADPDSVTVGQALASSARAMDATASLCVMPKLEAHDPEPPASIAAAMCGADVVFAVNEQSLSHTEARKRSTEEGTRVAILRGIDEEMMIEGAMTVDFAWLSEITGEVVDALTAADHARVTSPAGTDVEFSLEGRTAFPLDGYFHERAGFSNCPPGLAVSSPVDGSVEGTIVMDYSMDGFGKLDDEIELDVEAGHVSDVGGGREASEIRRILEAADPNAGNIAEFAIGTNPEARLIGNLAEDKKKQGVVDFALGDNTSIGGHTSSEIHLDFVVLDSTITLDGAEIQSVGELDLDVIRRAF